MSGATTADGVIRHAKRSKRRDMSLVRWLERRTLVPLILLGPLLAIATVVVLGQRDGAGGQALRVILLIDAVYLVAFVTVIVFRILTLLQARRAGRVGSKLHLRLAGTFAAVALIPAILVAVFATLSVNFGIESWFSERIGSVVGNALDVARAYEREHRENIRGDVLAMANDLNRETAGRGGLSTRQLNDIVRQQALLRELPEAFVFNSDREIIARGEFSYLFSFEPPTEAELARARTGEIVITGDERNNEIRALVYLTNFFDAFLYVSRDLEGEVLRLLDETEQTVQLYEQLERERGSLLRDFALIYIGFAMLVIASSTLAGLWVAERLARPVGRLAGAVQRIGEGDLAVRVKEERGGDEISFLSRSFNTMARQLSHQRSALVAASHEAERRRRLTEAVLSGVSAGVMALDGDGNVNMVNDAALELLRLDDGGVLGSTLGDVVPEFAPFLDTAREGPTGIGRGDVGVTVAGQPRQFLCRVALKNPEAPDEGWVLTFDDITALADAQRMAAWGDVARRIAHEIKNPLTPIQLSADRLRRKFVGQLGEDGTQLERMLDVITRQAGQIRRMVDAFSRFAKMPEPVLQAEDLRDLVREAVLLQEAGGQGTDRPSIRYDLNIGEGEMPVSADRGMIGQALTNLLQNAADAIEGRRERDAEAPDGVIHICAGATQRGFRIDILDNGVGLPAEGRERLTEPYMTTREKGTGLGLAIVRKIVEQHGGTLSLADAEGRHGLDGAMITLRIPRSARPNASKQTSAVPLKQNAPRERASADEGQ
ncbi:MAG: PAS domain-containing sensor histidine kinase [Pseudomonadota bacterium]